MKMYPFERFLMIIMGGLWLFNNTPTGIIISTIWLVGSFLVPREDK